MKQHLHTRQRATIFLLLAIFVCVTTTTQAQTTSFTYQGRLTDAGNPATGVYDLQFRLFDALAGGNPIGAPLTREDVSVSNGIFSVTLDFGAAAFPGANRWLEISVRPGASTGAFTTLSPLQPITSTPYAIKSANAAAADSLSATCTGCVTSAQIGSLPTNSGSYIQNTTTQQASSNFNISGNGVIGGALGIGISPPNLGGLLHVKGTSPVRILGDTTTLSGTESVDFFARSSLFNSDLGGMRIQRQANGNIDTLFFAAQTGNPASEKMRITGNGFLNVSGGGTFTGLNGDGAVLTARRANGDPYVLIDATPTTQNAVLAYRKNNLNRWLMYTDNTSEIGGGNLGSDFRLDAYNDAGNGIGTRLFIERASGHVGIGTTTPISKLDVLSTFALTAINGESTVSQGVGVRGVANVGNDAWGIVGVSTSGEAGHFAGNVGIYSFGPKPGNLSVAGVLSKGGGSFKIDHPLDPENKYLYHSFVESPDMMNIYNGNVTTDANGEATVTMPEWFEALNTDFRYQLTVIGQFAQAIVAEEISGNQFKLRTSLPGVKVSWQVTGVRHDAFANQHRIPVEELKPEEERGTYLHPDAFKQPAEKGLFQRQLQRKRAAEAATKQAPEKP